MYGIEKSETALKGSVYDVAARRGEDLASVIANVEVVIMLDTSGSMNGEKYERAKAALAKVQERFEGKVLVISFGSSVDICLKGIPASADGGSTPLTEALHMAKQFDGTGVRFIIISDGIPDNMVSAEETAKTFTDKIDTIFIGSDFDTVGIDFLRRIATGHSGNKVDPKLLADRIMGFLTDGSSSNA